MKVLMLRLLCHGLSTSVCVTAMVTQVYWKSKIPQRTLEYFSHAISNTDLEALIQKSRYVILANDLAVNSSSSCHPTGFDILNHDQSVRVTPTVARVLQWSVRVHAIYACRTWWCHKEYIYAFRRKSGLG